LRDAEQAPFSVGEVLNQNLFGFGGGREISHQAGDVPLVGQHIIRWQENGAASEAGFDGVE